MAKTIESALLKPEPSRIIACAKLAVERLASIENGESLAGRGFDARSKDDVLMFLSHREATAAIVLDGLVEERIELLGADDFIVRGAVREWDRLHIHTQLAGITNG